MCFCLYVEVVEVLDVDSEVWRDHGEAQGPAHAHVQILQFPAGVWFSLFSDVSRFTGFCGNPFWNLLDIRNPKLFEIVQRVAVNSVNFVHRKDCCSFSFSWSLVLLFEDV